METLFRGREANKVIVVLGEVEWSGQVWDFRRQIWHDCESGKKKIEKMKLKMKRKFVRSYYIGGVSKKEN